MTGKAKSVPLVLLSITLKASGLKTRLSVGVCNILCYDIRGFMKITIKEYGRTIYTAIENAMVNHFKGMLIWRKVVIVVDDKVPRSSWPLFSVTIVRKNVQHRWTCKESNCEDQSLVALWIRLFFWS